MLTWRSLVDVLQDKPSPCQEEQEECPVHETFVVLEARADGGGIEKAVVGKRGMKISKRNVSKFKL